MSTSSNDYYFPGKRANERIMLTVRRHSVAFSVRLTSLVFGAIIILVGFVLLRTLTTLLEDPTGLSYLLIVMFASLALLYIFLFLYHAWVDHYLDIWIITDSRIVAIEQHGLFHRSVSELRLTRVQDVQSEVRGIFPSLFRYGTVQVQTASGEDNFVFHEVAHPEKIARTIMELHDSLAPEEELAEAVPAMPTSNGESSAE